ncbi:MAG TPA: nucleotidyl transferase AbiEii/AbiGii toxin family protein [Pyrinomonadaceae bacterium]|nr:nucleotidyl transferase AbiEii/AbiGii toxin family protein [Pyrinomonadaceae bacterium]
MIDLIAEAHRFQTYCRSLGWDFCFIGGLALQHWGEPRLTRDIDVTILTGFGSESKFTSEILKSYNPRIPDADAFAQKHRVLLVRSSSGIDFDVSLAALPFEEQMIQRGTDVEYLPGIALRICSAEDLIVLKSFANRAQDWQDVSSVVTRQGVQNLDWDYITSSLDPLVAVKEEPQILERLENLRVSDA